MDKDYRARCEKLFASMREFREKVYKRFNEYRGTKIEVLRKFYGELPAPCDFSYDVGDSSLQKCLDLLEAEKMVEKLKSDYLNLDLREDFQADSMFWKPSN